MAKKYWGTQRPLWLQEQDKNALRNLHATGEAATGGAQNGQEPPAVLPHDPNDAKKRQEALEGEAAATREELKAEAEERNESGAAIRQDANQKSDDLYNALFSFSDKQDGRYDELYSMAKEDDYRSLAASRDILYEYIKNGATAAGGQAAAAAGANYGNGDSYAAALAGQTKAAYEAEGEAAARQYYGDYLDRLLSIAKTAGADMKDLYSAMQENVDGAQAVASDELSIGADLLATLADAEESAKKNETDIYSTLLDHTGSYQNASISPMELDAQFKKMTAGTKDEAAMSESDALIALWNQYPDMRGYILRKYELLFSPSYSFKE